MAEKRRFMTRSDVVKISAFLSTVIAKPKTSADFAVYADGWDDEKVAAKFGYKAGAIGRLRVELFGRLAPVANNNQSR